MNKITIIIPIYNVEDYLVTLLESLNNQSLERSKYKIVAINDLTGNATLAHLLK